MPARRRLTFPLLASCLFGSGLTALIYELLWTRRLQLTFGSTTLSVTTVLAGFMAGLGLGSYLVGRRVDRSRLGGVRIYGYLELGVGVYALVSLPLLSLVERLYATLQTWLQLGQGGATLLKFALCFPVLALPAALMGGTLPALVQGVLRSRDVLPRTVGRLYGVNTAGAALGTVLAGMVLVEVLGLWPSMIAAAVVNLGIAALVLSRQRGVAVEPRPREDGEVQVSLSRHLRSRPVLFCAIAVGFTGALSMLYEVVWTRLLSLVLGSSTYSFTIVLAIFLLGIAGGALIYARVQHRRGPTPYGLTRLLLALALWVLISLALIPAVPKLLLVLGQIPGVTFARVLAFEVLLALVVLLAPALILGAALPMSIGIIARSTGQVGRDVGGVYLVNTAGAIIGSTITGFLLVPAIGTQNTLLAGLLVNLALCGWGVWSFTDGAGRRALELALVVAVATVAMTRPPWPPSVFDSGLGYRLGAVVATTERGFHAALHRSPSRLLYREEGRNGTVSVREYRSGVSLLVNGKPDASSRGDMTTQVTLGVIPAMAHPRPVDVAVVGWGSGVTTWAVTLFPTVKAVDVVEIEPAVLRASRFFHAVNGAVEHDPRVRVTFDDARSYLRTSGRRYDVVISEPSNVWMAGVSSLFSTEFYQLARQRMRRGGVFAQWLQLYSIDSTSVGVVLQTFTGSFPHAQLWISDSNNLVLLGSDRPIHSPLERIARAYQESPALRWHMAAWGPGPRPGHFFGAFLLDGEGIKAVLEKRGDDEVMTDDRPVLEYRAIRGLYDNHHRHAAALLRAKLALGQVLPRGAGRRARPGEAVAGAARALRGADELRRMLTRWAARFNGDPEVRLCRALTLVRAGRLEQALKLGQSLPADQPRFAAEAALLEARVRFRRGEAQRAYELLARIPRGVRPAVRKWYQLRIANRMGLAAAAFEHAEQLIIHLVKSDDPEAPRLPRATIYKEIGALIKNNQEYDKGVQLLSAAAEDPYGRYHRLLLLASIADRAGRTSLAVRAMNELMTWAPVGDRPLLLCERVYRRAGAPAKAALCRERRLRLAPTPGGPALWR